MTLSNKEEFLVSGLCLKMGPLHRADRSLHRDLCSYVSLHYQGQDWTMDLHGATLTHSLNGVLSEAWSIVKSLHNHAGE